MENGTRPVLGQKEADDKVGGKGERSLLETRRLSVKQAAQKLSIGETTLRSIIRAGELKVVKIRGKLQLAEDDLEAFLQSRYGTMTPSRTAGRRKLPPLPQEVRESEFIELDEEFKDSV
jgi:excisionase family DNA binding protein